MSENKEDRKWGRGVFGWEGKMGNKIVGLEVFSMAHQNP